ncbi:bifunctional serine/threonine-protein kinase/formylglycine-generating enzyme family protein [Rhabdochlamydiaceae symbiont of Dictyostelium giganteum]|uniref:bifunctional serine/threonine-protein kinase/formylglycine-generating enzyme family protein n=1 Tax=Rhabdochlamydiaceae symbiont of Dictyostelium giganteum TaxID=3342349 RepID=UPI0038511C69
MESSHLRTQKHTLQVGDQLGDYRLLELLGYGALGQTFTAEHRFLQKKFVIKVIDAPLYQHPQFLKNFETYIAEVALLNHDNLLPLQHVSEEGGVYFIVSECLSPSFKNLHTYLEGDREPLLEKEILEIALQLASLLDYAHKEDPSKKRIAHLALKPSNILVEMKGAHITVKVTDFALSLAVGPSYLAHIYNHIAQIPQTEEISQNSLSFLHHYLFLSPEFRWQKKLASPFKSDIYAFGILLYLMLTRTYPEGAFEPVSTLAPQHKLQWDPLIRLCLAEESKRIEQLMPLMQELLQGSNENLPLKPILKPKEIQKPEYDPDPGAIFHVEKVVARYNPDPQKKVSIEPLLTEMCVIQGGEFERGSNKGGRDEAPRHTVFLNPYAIDIHPVTNEQFIRFLEEMGGEKDHHNNDIIRLRESRIKKAGGQILIESGYAKHPVVGVSWYGAMAYAKWVGKRLPSEAEWEIAAAGGLINPLYPTDLDIDRTQANFFSSDTTAVMSYPPNGYGLYDMAGNVYEWCQDWYDYHYYNTSVQEPHEPKGPHQGVYRVLRGGCWKSLKEDLRCAHRHRNNPGTVNGTYGFRLVADVIL